jgi:hypothetical protein
MIRSMAFVLAASAARDPVPAPDNGIVSVQPLAVHDGWPPHGESFRSWVYTSDELERYGARTLSDALRLTPGVVMDPSGRIFIHGTPLGDGSVMIDGVSLMGAPRATP